MIRIIVDTHSEFQWIKCVIENGLLHRSPLMDVLQNEFDIEPVQEVTYRPSYNFVDDIGELVKTYNEKVRDHNTVRDDELK